jgi:hypothetical protein
VASAAAAKYTAASTQRSLFMSGEPRVVREVTRIWKDSNPIEPQLEE